MSVYVVCLKLISIINITVSMIYVFIGIAFPKKIYAGMTLNNIGFVFYITGLFTTALLFFIYYLLEKPSKEIMLKLDTFQIVILILSAVYVIYRVIFCGSGLTTTSKTLMLFISVVLHANIGLYIVMTNILRYLKH